jgi:hypothetical protein
MSVRRARPARRSAPSPPQSETIIEASEKIAALQQCGAERPFTIYSVNNMNINNGTIHQLNLGTVGGDMTHIAESCQSGHHVAKPSEQTEPTDKRPVRALKAILGYFKTYLALSATLLKAWKSFVPTIQSLIGR